MDINDILKQSGGLQSMANELGIDPAQAATGAAALLPAVLGGFKKQTQSGGLEGLGGLLGKLGGGGLLDEVLSPQPTNVNRGNDVLAQIFGSKDVSRTVAQHASTRSGIDPALLRKMLPMVAMVVAGFMAKQHTGASSQSTKPSGGGIGAMLGNLIGGRAGGNATTGGMAGIAKMIDMDGDGNPLDDIMKMVGKS